jgi:hypothetical protein
LYSTNNLDCDITNKYFRTPYPVIKACAFEASYLGKQYEAKKLKVLFQTLTCAI